MPDPNHQLRVVGPAFEPAAAHRVPAGGSYQPDRLAAENPPDPLDAELTADDEAVDAGRVIRRLVVAFVAFVGIGMLNVTVLRRFDADLPPVVLLGTFAVILVATGISMMDRSTNAAREDELGGSDGCAIGACPGPRPVGELSRRLQERAEHQRRLTDGRPH